MIGISNDDFWSMTPYQLRVAVSAHAEKQKNQHRHDLSIAWYAAVFQRAKQLPRLESLFEEPETNQQAVAAKLIHHLKMHNAALKVKENAIAKDR